MEPRTKNLVLGGAIALGCAVCGWYLYCRSQAVKESKPTSAKPKAISKTLIIQLLKEQERECYTFMRATAQIFKEVSAARGKPIQYMSFAEQTSLREAVFRSYPLIEEKFNDSAKDIVEKYGFSEADYGEALLVTFKNDRDVQRLSLQIQDCAEKACTGIPPSPARSIPVFLTKEKALQVAAKLIKLDNDKVMKCFEVIDDQSKAFWSNKENIARLVANTRIAVKINNEKKKILAEEGLDDFEEAAERILDTAIFMYRRDDPEFRRKISDLEDERVDLVKEIQRKLIQSAKREEGAR